MPLKSSRLEKFAANLGFDAEVWLGAGSTPTVNILAPGVMLSHYLANKPPMIQKETA